MSKSLAELLVKDKIISANQFSEAAEAARSGKSYVRYLIEKKYVSETKLLYYLSQKFGLPSINLAKFEIPQEVENNGMLGVGWLGDQKVIVDYDEYRVGMPDSVAASEAEDKGLLARGYVGHKMTADPKTHTWFVMGKVDGHAIRLCVSTVAETVIDREWAKANNVELGPVIDQQGGPAGALVNEYLAKRVLPYMIDGQNVPPPQPHSWDLAAYNSTKRSDEPHDEGYIGADFMLANQAIIDFGTEMLFLAKWSGDK